MPDAQKHFIVEAPFEMSRDKPDIVGRAVLIDGGVYTVIGVERRMPSFPIRTGEVIGVRVTPLPRPFHSPLRLRLLEALP